MDARERIEAFWAGGRPDQIPYTVYHWLDKAYTDRPELQALFRDGLMTTHHAATWRQTTPGVETVKDAVELDGAKLARLRMTTPVGEICQLSQAGWTQKHWLATSEDYRVMRWIVEHTELSACYDEYRQFEKSLPPHGVPLVFLGRTPIQNILVDYAGLESFAMHLFDMADEVTALYEALLKLFRRRVEIVAAGPGRFVSCLENFTAETMGPNRFRQFILPVYEEFFPALHQAGKIVGTHYDGKIASCAEMIAASPVDLIESLTPPPEGDLTLAQARKAFGNKLFWANINVSNYQLPPKQLRQLVIDLVAQGSVDGKYLAFEVSEDWPPNWDQSIRVVLETLREMK